MRLNGFEFENFMRIIIVSFSYYLFNNYVVFMFELSESFICLKLIYDIIFVKSLKSK